MSSSSLSAPKVIRETLLASEGPRASFSAWDLTFRGGYIPDCPGSENQILMMKLLINVVKLAELAATFNLQHSRDFIDSMVLFDKQSPSGLVETYNTSDENPKVGAARS